MFENFYTPLSEKELSEQFNVIMSFFYVVSEALKVNTCLYTSPVLRLERHITI